MKLKFYHVFIICIVLIACNNKKEAEYFVNKQSISNGIELKQWNVLGPIKSLDTTASTFLDNDHIVISGVKEHDFIKDPYSYNLIINSKFLVKGGLRQGYYCSKGSIIDYEEISGIKKEDLKEVKGSAVYLYCKIYSDKDRKVYFMCHSTNGLKVWLNDKFIDNSEEGNEFDFIFNVFFTLNLKKGLNTLVIKKINLSNEIYFESLIGDERIKLYNYHKVLSKNLIFHYPITNDKLWLKANHAKELDTSITYHILNLNAHEVFSKQLTADSANYLPVASLPINHSYLCYFIIKGYTFSQPFFIGNPDTAFSLFSRRCDKYHNYEVFQQTGAYLFRLKFLLGHESRKTDLWWSFKVSNILYELENYLNNIDKKQNEFLHSYGIILRAYTSTLDRSTQHYLLITPDSIKSNDTMPLVVVIRPIIENHHHFLASPQMARFWSLSYAKYLANKYKYIIIMPSGRLYLDEKLIPIAEKEIFNAIEDVQKHLHIDKQRVYLHGNCSAGYRCLSLACHYHGMFAAIGLYAPVYHFNIDNEWVKKNSPENLLVNLCNIPVMLHYDPQDTHSPYSFFEDLIKDCNKKDIKIQVTSSKLSDKHYNVMMVGEEAFAFFQGKKRAESPLQVKHISYNEKYNHVNWISYKSTLCNEKTSIKAEFIKSGNKIICSGENISKLELELSGLDFNKKALLIVEYNGNKLYRKICDVDTLKLSICNPVQENNNDLTAHGKIIADLFAEPFIFTYENQSGHNKNLVDSIKNEYEHYLFAKCPIKPINELSSRDLAENNLFIIGHKFDNKLINSAMSKLPLSVKTNEVSIFNKSYPGDQVVFQAIFKSPFNPKKLMVVYSTNDPHIFVHEINFPWKDGLENCIVRWQ